MKRRNLIGCCLFGVISLAGAKDPLVKDVDEPTVAEESVFNVACMIEYYRVPNAKLDDWYQNAEDAADAEKLREEILSWVAAEEASLVDALMQAGKSGQRSKVESGAKLIFPAEHVPADISIDPSAPPFPCAWESRSLGSIFEWAPLLSSDIDVVDVSIALKRLRYVGESRLPGSDYGGRVKPDDVVLPAIKEHGVSAAVTLRRGGWLNVGTFDPVEDPDEATIVGLMTADSVPVPRKVLPLDVGIQLRFEWVEMKTKDWLEVTASLSQAERCHGLYEALDFSEGGNASIQNRQSIPTLSGQRARAESDVVDVNYALEYERPKIKGGRAFMAGAETRQTGTSVAVDPVLSSSGILDLNFSAENTTLVKDDVLYRALSEEGAWVPTVTFPRFYSMKTTQSLSLAYEENTLGAVFSPPGTDGNPDPSRKMLLFVRYEAQR